MPAKASAAETASDEIFFLGLPTWIRADRDRTGGNFSMIEQIIPAGFESPWHVHHTEDESSYVIDGAVTVTVDGATAALGAGGFAFGPRGVPHGFRVDGDRRARILLMTSGGDFADFIVEASVAADAPPSASDMEALMAAATRHNLGIIGPLPR